MSFLLWGGGGGGGVWACLRPHRPKYGLRSSTSQRPSRQNLGVARGDAPTLERVDEVLETDGESCRFLDLVMDRDSAFFRLVYDFLDLVMDRDNAFFRLVYDLERECLFFCGELEVGVGFGLVWGWGLGLKQRMVELG